MTTSTEAPVNAGKRPEVKTLRGEVVSTAMAKTAVVRVERRMKHPLYGKTIRRHKKYLCHDEQGLCGMGDLVEILPCRPISKRKRWRVSRIIEKAE